MAKSARQITFEALMRVQEDSAYSNITLNSLLGRNSLSNRDKAFASMLFYGVLEKKLLLEYNLAQYSAKPVNKLDAAVLTILGMGLYQLYFMDAVPESAAVNESVKLCKDNKLYSASKFVNAVLRAATKENNIKLPDKRRGKNKYLSIKYSCPEAIIRLWRSSYGDELTEGILKELDGRPPMTARVNTLKISKDELIGRFSDIGITAVSCEKVPDCIELQNTGAVEELALYKEGSFHIQDRASQLCCGKKKKKSGNTVIDACSAPGGKAFTLSEMMKNQGSMIACDLYEHRLGLIEDGAKRLGINIIETIAASADKYRDFPQADRVLCDVPCSGLGIIRRKPELRYKQDLGLENLPDLQYNILRNCADFVKKGGLLIYSTCTLNPDENGRNAERFLSERKDFEPYEISLPDGIRRGMDEPENQLTLFPQINGTDGFFISAFQKTGA